MAVMAGRGRPRGTTEAQIEKIEYVTARLVEDQIFITDTDCRNYVEEYLEEGGYPKLSVSGLTQFMRQVRTYVPSPAKMRTQINIGLNMAERMAREQDDTGALARVQQIRAAHVDKIDTLDEEDVATKLDKEYKSWQP